MSDFNITVPGGESKRLKTGGKYCPADIVVTAENIDPLDAYWEIFQQGGKRTDYGGAFSCTNLPLEAVMNPKYPICPDDRGRSYTYEGARIFDYFRRHENTNWSEMGITLDMSKVSYPIHTFANTGITNLDVDLSNAKELNQTFCHSDCGCEHGDLNIRLKVSEKCTYSLPFAYCSKFVNIIFTDDSVIGNSGIDVSLSTRLTHESLMSMVNALKDYSGTGTTRSITFGAENLAKLTDAEKSIATGKGWTLA